jgi:hypothetical protein
MESDKKALTNPEKILNKIRQSQYYESPYYAQAFEAYRMYSNCYNYIRKYARTSVNLQQELMNEMETRRSNVYFSNTETLKGLIVPELPNVVVSLNGAKKVENTKENKAFYDTLCNILQTIGKNVVDAMPKGLWDSFKMDYLITGRGVLWVNVDEEEEGKSNVSIDQVRWQDFTMDTRPKWTNVDWVARRLLFSKKSFLDRFKVSAKGLQGLVKLQQIYSDTTVVDVYNDNSKYVEVWEYWDKQTMTCYWVSKQWGEQENGDGRFLIAKKEYDEDADRDYFLPTPEPPLLINNGINLIPFSDVWNYANELRELNAIAEKRTALIEGLELRGFTDTARGNVLKEMNMVGSTGLSLKSKEVIVSVAGFTPNDKEPLIHYVDNTPRVQILDFLQKEYQFLIDRIYNITGLSEQMKNITPVDDNPNETATATRIKTKFGSRRLKEHQERLLGYWSELLKITLRRITSAYDEGDYKKIFNYKFRSSNSEDLQENVFNRSKIQKQIKKVQGQIQALQQAGGGQDAQPQGAVPPVNMGSAAEAQPPNPMQQAQPQGQPQGQSPQEDASQAQGAANGGGGDEQQPQPDTTQQGVNPQVVALQQATQANDQLQQQIMQLTEQYEELTNEITWQRIMKFFRKDRLVSFLVAATIDDLENKVMTDEKRSSDMQYMGAMVQNVNQIIANVNQNPTFADIYCALFSMAVETFDQTKSERDDIDKFIKEIKATAKKLIEQPPQQPPPSPQDQKYMAEAAELQAKAQLLQAQAQEIAVKLQMEQAQQQQGQVGDAQSAQAKQQELQVKHQQDMELQQAKIAADQSRAREKMQSDQNLMQMKIEADKERYAEKNKADAMKTIGGDGLGGQVI